MAVILKPQQPTLRSYVVFDEVPTGCMPFLITDRRAEPILRPGDTVLVDTSDSEPAEHDLFVVEYGKNTPHPRRCVAETYTQQHRNGEREFTGWWTSPLNRPRTKEEAQRWFASDKPLYFSDGPINAASSHGMDYLRDMIVGRVIGLLDPAFAEPMRLARPSIEGRA